MNCFFGFIPSVSIEFLRRTVIIFLLATIRHRSEKRRRSMLSRVTHLACLTKYKLLING